MSSFSFFIGFISLMVYVAVPIAVIFIILWIYRIKQNSDIQVEQNKEIIQLLEKLSK